MKHFPAADLNRAPAGLFEAATLEPIAITMHRKPRYVMMSIEHYESLIEGNTVQVAVSVADLREDIGALLDKGIIDHFDDK